MSFISETLTACYSPTPIRVGAGDGSEITIMMMVAMLITGIAIETFRQLYLFLL